MRKLENLHILIAEDDEDDAEVILGSFRKNSNYTKIDLVTNGQKLLDYLAKNTNPDIILTDINMPVLNGIEALQEIVGSGEYSDIPAFVYSTSINPVYEAKCNELGIKGFLIKPFSLEEFDEIPQHIITILENSDQK